MRKIISKTLLFQALVTGLLLFVSQGLLADSDDGPPHKIVIQVSTDDPRTQQIALNNAINLQKALGQDNVAIEIVA